MEKSVRIEIVHYLTRVKSEQLGIHIQITRVVTVQCTDKCCSGVLPKVGGGSHPLQRSKRYTQINKDEEKV